MPDTFRLWWQKPRKIGTAEEERTISFLELFYDLAYVVIVAELIHMLGAHFDAVTLQGFLFLFVLVWWGWVNGSLYHELHGNNDIRTRFFTFLQMGALGVMAIYISTALGEGYRGFALGYGFFMTILTYLWWRTGVHEPAHRSIAYPYTLSFLLLTIVFVASAFVSREMAHIMWACVTIASILVPIILISTVFRGVDHEHHEQSMRVRAPLVERFDLFTIIVLGEIIRSVVQGIAHHEHIMPLQIVQGMLGIGIAVGMWWLYFDFGSKRLPVQRDTERVIWYYIHLLISGSIAVTGAAILSFFGYASNGHFDYWTLSLPIAVFLLSMIALLSVLHGKKANHAYVERSKYSLLIAVIGVITITAIVERETWYLLLLNLCLLLPIFRAFQLWIQRYRQRHHA